MPREPNVLIFHTDQQSAWTLGAYGGTLVDTPNADRLAREGAMFTSFFTNSALCTPSRGCMLTGRYPHCHGAYDNNIELARDQVTFAHVLAGRDYETGYAGKWHLDGEPRPGWLTPERSMGFAHCRWMFNRGHTKRVVEGAGERPALGPLDSPGRYMTDWLADKTIEFVSAARRRPFLWMVSFPDPHTPFNVAEPYASMFDPADMPVPETFHEEHLPSWAAAHQWRCDDGADAGAAEALLRRRMAAYCGEVKCIDDNLGRVLECLAARGLLETTVVIFTTDHGEYMGEHGLYHKNHVYETAYRIPLLVRWPEAVRPGTVVDRVVGTVDFQPTLLGLLGVPPAGSEQGRDGSGLLRAEDVGWDDAAFLHHNSFDLAGVFTPSHELALARGAEHVLFDRRSDPLQVRNLIGDPAAAGVASDLARRVVEHNRRLGSPATAWLEGIDPGAL